MPPALHPRSSMTLTLFSSTLALSFLVVGLPHLVPCPVQPQAFADDGTPLPRRQRRRRPDDSSTAGDDTLLSDSQITRRRECPVPKPGGLVGQVLGLTKGDDSPEKPVVRIEKFEPRIRRIAGQEGDGKG
ncbi:uncharacterized protein PV09_06724 [Verruconis gallopava]|uniref:Alpha-1,3-mannosyltransferase n=1 Tax=Verruconis gallopava TaxID=253628 RepID=A0A0D1XHZ0_9PEZI|nr:uncharacterized protein PV09_06724 [Verruconis gallopava]KIW01876.1 hypothetical protein PV09_06724 [Verruconis gallopava]